MTLQSWLGINPVTTNVHEASMTADYYSSLRGNSVSSEESANYSKGSGESYHLQCTPEFERDALMEYMTDPNTSLFKKSDPEKKEVKLSKSDLDYMLLLGSGIESLLRILDQAQIQGKVFPDKLALMNALKKGKLKLATRLVYQHLKSSGREGEFEIADNEIDSLLKLFNYDCTDLLITLKKMDNSNLDFFCFQSMCYFARYYLEQRKKMIAQHELDLKTLADFFSSEECKLFNAMTKTIRVTTDSLDRIILESHGITMALKALQTLSREGARVNSFEEVLPLVSSATAIDRHIENTTLMNQFLSADYTNNFNIMDISAFNYNTIITTYGSPKKVVSLFETLVQRRCRFNQFSKLSDALEIVYMEQLSATTYIHNDSDFKVLLGYLVSPQCKLFSELDTPFTIAEPDMCKLLKLGGGVLSLGKCLRDLDADGKKFESLEAIIEVIEGLKEVKIHTA